MPQLMPLMWVLSSFIVMIFILIGLMIYWSENLNLSKFNLYFFLNKYSNWKW